MIWTSALAFITLFYVSDITPETPDMSNTNWSNDDDAIYFVLDKLIPK